MALTVTDMNRLEQAARISMGEFQDPETAAPSPHVSHIPLRLIASVLVAVIVVIAAAQLL